jgi:ComF family protein
LRVPADDPERPRGEDGDARDRVVARYALPFGGPARALVHALKYSGRRGAAGILVSAAADEARAAARASVDALVPVPLHPSRQRERGFNQAEVLARGLAAFLDVPVAAGCLARTRATRTQTGLERGQRAVNVRGAFAAAPPPGVARVLLVDDVVTTGATLSEAAAALAAAGVRCSCFALVGANRVDTPARGRL